MPNGKPAGVRCIQLDDNNACRLFGHPERPLLCEHFLPEPGVCGEDREQALQNLAILEQATGD